MSNGRVVCCLTDKPTEEVADVMDSWQIREQSDTCSTPDVTHYCSALSAKELEVIIICHASSTRPIIYGVVAQVSMAESIK